MWMLTSDETVIYGYLNNLRATYSKVLFVRPQKGTQYYSDQGLYSNDHNFLKSQQSIQIPSKVGINGEPRNVFIYTCRLD